MGNKALRLEVSKLRTLVKKTRTNIIRKLLRDRKLWAGKVEASSSNRRASKKLEAAEALSKHIKALRTSQLVKDVIRFQLRKDAAGEQQLTTVADRAITRFYGEPKVVASVRVLVDRFELQKNEELIDVAVKDGVKDAKDVPTGDKRGKKKKKTKPKRAKDEKKVTTKVTKNGKQKATKEGKGKAKEEDEDELSDSQDNDEPSDVSVSMSEDEESILDDAEEEHETPSKPTKNAAESKPKPATKEKKKKEPKMKLKMPTNLKPPEDDDEEEACLMVQDSFFVTESGTNYVAVAPVLKKSEEGDSDENNNDDEEEEESWKFSVKRRKKQEQRNAAQGKVPDGGKPSRNGKFESNKRSSAFSNEPAKRFRRDSGGQTEPDPGLHPSWAAKQKQKGIIPFAGKKVVFDDTGAQPVATSAPNKAKEDLHPSWAAKQAQKGIKPFAGKKVVFDDDESTSAPATKSFSANDLHPSWAAKQAQKGIKPFSGKKTVFDHREDTSGRSDLHPSWAAKQAQKGIKPFAGKKKVFDDNEDNRHQERQRTETTTNTEGLHSSWAAKQAQKGLKPFAGKKITFGDDETAPKVNAHRPNNGSRAAAKPQPTAISSDLHPSWAAKQAQKGIKQFEGKKISFDD